LRIEKGRPGACAWRKGVGARPVLTEPGRAGPPAAAWRISLQTTCLAEKVLDKVLEASNVHRPQFAHRRRTCIMLRPSGKRRLLSARRWRFRGGMARWLTRDPQSLVIFLENLRSVLSGQDGLDAFASITTRPPILCLRATATAGQEAGADSLIARSVSSLSRKTTLPKFTRNPADLLLSSPHRGSSGWKPPWLMKKVREKF